MIRSKLHVYELSKSVYFLNRHLNDLNERLKVCEPEHRSSLRNISGGLYRLKESVVLKMLREGYCSIRNYETNRGAKHYVVRLMHGILINLTVSSRVRQAVIPYKDERKFVSDERKTMINLDYSFEDVSEKLNAYLRGELEIVNDLSIMGNVERKESIPYVKDAECTLEEDLIKAVAVLNTLIILRFQANERPLPRWIFLWKKSIAIAEQLTLSGAMIFEGEGFFFRKGYLFHCRIYFAEGLGQVAVLNYPYQALPVDSDNEQTEANSTEYAFPRMPPILSWSNSAGIRQRYAEMIRQYELASPESTKFRI